MSSFGSREETISFREIVLSHLKRILEISSTEFRGGYWMDVPTGNMIARTYVPDSICCYVQSIDSLHDVLTPHFDEKMEKASKEYTSNRNKAHADLSKKWKEDSNLRDNSDFNVTWSSIKLPLARKLFQELNMLLNRKQYLKTSVYGEARDDIIED